MRILRKKKIREMKKKKKKIPKQNGIKKILAPMIAPINKDFRIDVTIFCGLIVFNFCLYK